MVADQEEQKVIDWTHMLATTTAMVDALEYYLIEGSIFRTVMARWEHGFERVTMSVGELLTLLNWLQAQQHTATGAQREQLKAMLTTMQRTREQFSDLFYQMAVREIMSRLDSINWFLHDCENHKQSCRLDYPREIRNRQRIEALVIALGEEMSEDVAERIERIDRRIRAITYKSEFVWPAKDKEIYPEMPYWYLYASPK
jgi:hypothetical protein